MTPFVATTLIPTTNDWRVEQLDDSPFVVIMVVGASASTTWRCQPAAAVYARVLDPPRRIPWRIPRFVSAMFMVLILILYRPSPI